ncbi:caveolin-2 [Synchiropus picturatus]
MRHKISTNKPVVILDSVAGRMTMVSDDCLVECRIDDSDEDDGSGEQMRTPPPPPEFASKGSTPSPKPPTPPAAPTLPVSRDPYGINRHLKVDVSDVLAEPAAPRSIDQVWLYSVVGFEKTRVWTYTVLSLLLAVPFAFLCGLFLAVLACLHVWFVVPFLQLSNTFLPCLRSIWICSLNVFISPLCSSLALCCSQVVVSLSKQDWTAKKEREIA